jgi:Flp pilus assembly protein TadG
MRSPRVAAHTGNLFAVWRGAAKSWLGNARGSQLVEFAFMLPLLSVMTIGIVDFAQGFLLKQKLTNAAREGARIGAELSNVDIDQTAPPTVQSIRNAVVEYLDNADLDVSGFDATSTKTGPTEWTYYDGTDAVIIIDRAVVVPTSGAISTRVTVQYPFTWAFSDVIQLLVPSATYASAFLISTDATMTNLVN